MQAKPMHSPVNWALLGLIIERPSYAYELAQRFDRTYEGALSLSSVSHVYTALTTLRGRSLIEEIPGTRAGRQPKPCYCATAKGLADYRQWLLGQLADDRRRRRLFVLQLAALTRDPDSALAIVADYESECLKEAGDTPIRQANREATEPDSAVTARLIAEENRLAIGAKLAWVQYARRELGARASTRTPRG